MGAGSMREHDGRQHARRAPRGVAQGPVRTLLSTMPVLLDLPEGLEAARELLAVEPATLRAKVEACNEAELEAIIAQYKAALSQVLDAGRALGEARGHPNCGAGRLQSSPPAVQAQGCDQTPGRCAAGSPQCTAVAGCRRRRLLPEHRPAVPFVSGLTWEATCPLTRLALPQAWTLMPMRAAPARRAARAAAAEAAARRAWRGRRAWRAWTGGMAP